jgi:flagellar motility protein MotE (MotC chaperone)
MFVITPIFILCTSFVLFFVLIALIYRQRLQFAQISKAHTSQLKTQELLFSELQAFQKTLSSEFASSKAVYKSQQLENEQVSKQLEHRIKVLQQESATQKQLIELIKNQQPQDKLYSRAFKLVELGADIDEVVRECDIPRAEAEMLMSVHKNKTSPS